MIGVVGGGQMGAGIAEVAAKAGQDVVLIERDDALAQRAVAGVQRSMARGVERGKLDQATADAALARVTATTDWQQLVGARFIVEAVPEQLELKATTFARLSELTQGSDTILATNTSSIPIAQVAAHTDCPDRVIGLHFFNPVPVLRLVEVVPSLLTSQATIDTTAAFAADELDRQVIHAKDRAGFVVNALLVPYLLSAIRMFEAGHASAEDIDTGMVSGCGHPMGPLALADMIGLDTCLAVADSLLAEFHDPTLAAPPLLKRMVEAGLLGRKAGRGFYSY